MKSLIADVIGLAGFGLLTCGVYLQFGMAPALILSGALLLVGALATDVEKMELPMSFNWLVVPYRLIPL
ncbi:hypothetical protein [Escherichia coli]|uniref:hypothetical protein n=1 Tax=Escherichia coli TaxID=562 RepID=UPI0032633DAF